MNPHKRVICWIASFEINMNLLLIGPRAPLFLKGMLFLVPHFFFGDLSRPFVCAHIESSVQSIL